MLDTTPALWQTRAKLKAPSRPSQTSTPVRPTGRRTGSHRLNGDQHRMSQRTGQDGRDGGVRAGAEAWEHRPWPEGLVRSRREGRPACRDDLPAFAPLHLVPPPSSAALESPARPLSSPPWLGELDFPGTGAPGQGWHLARVCRQSPAWSVVGSQERGCQLEGWP